MDKKEKEIIKRLKDTFSEDMEKITFHEDGIVEIRKALNFIEKLQKEIEDWKDVCHSLTDEEELENKIKLFKPSIKALNKLEDGKKEAQFMSKLIKYYKVILKEKKQIYEELKRRNENNG